MSDLHIGANDFPEEALKGLDSALELARETSVDAILIAGDLFDRYGVPEATVGRVMDDLAACGKPVVVLPGNHDTVLTRDGWSGEPPDNVTILKAPEGEMALLDELGLAVWGRPVYDHHPRFRPLEGMPARPWNGWYVPMGHGLFMDVPEVPPRSSPISPVEVSQASCDYIALGHVHVFRDVSRGGVPAFYSGAPSGSQPRTAALVELDPASGVAVRPLQIS
jgi:DNA repair exonuclease SbcCD nuclease subunit